MKRYTMKNLLAVISAVLFSPLIFGPASDLWAFQLISSTTINGAGNAADGSSGVAVDPSGNIWVTGYSSITVQGANIWLAKFNPFMILQASTTINGPGNGTDYGNHIVADPSGNIWAAGQVLSATGGQDIWLAKYNSSMVLQSSMTINGPGNADDAANDVTVDPSGNIWLTGSVTGSVGGVNIWLAKYDSSMVLQASTTVNGASGSSDYGQGITADPGGNIWVTGQVIEPTGGENAWIAKYNSSMVLQSSTTINGSAGGSDYGFDISTGPGGSIWVTGRIAETGQADNIWIAKYDSVMVLQSSTTINGSGNGNDAGYAITADTGGNIWVTGYSSVTVQGANIWIAKYNSSMVLQSSTTINGSANGSDVGQSIIVDSGGNIWVTGALTETVGGANIWLAKYMADPAVNLLVQNAAGQNFRYSATNPVLKLSLWTDVGTSNWSQLALLVGGNLNPASDTGSVYLYRDSNSDGVYNSSDSFVTFMSPVSGGFTLNFSETIGVSTGVYFVTMTPTPSAIGRMAALVVQSTNSVVVDGAYLVNAVTALPAQSAAAKVMNYIYATETGVSNANTDIPVLAGQALQINATGYWNFGAGPVSAAGSVACSVGCPLPAAPRGALIARGNTTPWFVVGLSTTIMFGYSDTLYLAMNDDNYGDNSGFMMFEKAAQAVTKVWTGAACGPSSCFDASMPGNWLGNMVPAYGDNVVFSSGSKNCYWNLGITPNSISLNPGYTGRVSLMNAYVDVSDYLHVRSGTMDIAGNTLTVSTITVSGGALDMGGGYGTLRVGEGGLNISSTGTLVFNGSMNANIERIAASYFPISVTGGTVAVNGAGLLNIFGSNGITISDPATVNFNNVRIQNLSPGAAALRVNAASGVYNFNNWGFDSSVSTNVTGAGLSGSATVYMTNSQGDRRGTPYEYDPQNRIVWNPDGGGFGSVNGFITYSGFFPPDTYLIFVTTDLAGSTFVAVGTSAAGGYQFTALDAPATYYIWAIRDGNADNLFTASLMEPVGWTGAPFYLAVGAALTVDLTLMDTGKVTGNIDRSFTTQAGPAKVELYAEPVSTSSLMDVQELVQSAFVGYLAAYAVAAPSATYTVLAYVDVNQNGRLDPAFESSGTLTGLTISTQADLSGQDIVLSPGAVEPGGVVSISTAAFAGSFIGRTSSAALLKLGLVSNGQASTVVSMQFAASGTAQADKFSLDVYKDDGNGIFDNDPSDPNPAGSDAEVGYSYFNAVSSQAVISFYSNVEIAAGATQYFFVTMMSYNPAAGSTIGAVLLSSDSVGLLKGTMANQAVYPVSTPLRTVRESLNAWSTLNTGLYPISGQTVSVSAAGLWLVNGATVSPTGAGSNMYNGVYPDKPVGALIAQVGYNSPWIYIGTSTTFVHSGPTGQLMLHMNANYDFTNQMWNYPNGVSGELYVDYSVAGDTHAVLSGTVSYAVGGSNGNIIVNAVRQPQAVIIGTHTIPTPLAGGASYYTMTGIEIPEGDMAYVTVSAYLESDPSQHGTGSGEIQVRIGQPATGGDVTVHPGLGILKGTVTYSGGQLYGNTVVAVFIDLDNSQPVALSTLPAGVSTFTVTDIPGPAAYYVIAFKDMNDNFDPDGPEPFGYYGVPGPLSLLTTNAYLINISSGGVDTNMPAAIAMNDVGQISGVISLGELLYPVNVVVEAGHGIPGSSFVKENRMDYSVQPCTWYGCVNEINYNVGTLFPADDYSVTAFMDKNNNWQWDCADAQNCERFSSSRTGIVVSSNGMAQADITLAATPTPDMPQSFSGTAQSVTQILWTWNDVPTETNYYLLTSTGGILYELAANTTEYLETAAGASNILVSRRIMARNAAGDSPLSALQTRYTTAEKPALTVTGRTSSGVTLDITDATQRFTMERSTFAGGGFNVVYSTYAATPVTARTDAGLTPSVTYYYRAVNYNGDDIASAYATVVSTLTLPPAGSYINGTVSYPGLMTGNITVLASTNLLMTSPVVLTLAGSATQTYYLSGLSASTSYYMRAFVDYNADGLRHASEDAGAIVGPVYVPASGGVVSNFAIVRSTASPAAPSGLIATPGFQSGASLVSLSWTAPNAANIAGYEVYRSTHALFSSAVVKVSGSQYVSGTSFTDLAPLTGLAAYYRVRAVDWGMNFSAGTGLSSPVNVSAGGSIIGMVSAVDTSTGGLYHVRVSTTPDASVPSIVDIIVSTASPYTVSGLADGIYYVRGYRDFNGDFKQDRKTEPSGTHGGIARPFDLYVTQGGSLAGINLKVCNRIPLAVGVSTQAAISAAGCEALDRGTNYYTRIFTFEVGYGAGKVPPGSQVTVYANNVSGINDAYLYLVGPSGDVAARDDDSGGNRNSRIQYTVDTPGIYLIEPTSYASGMAGTLEVGYSITGGFSGQIAGTLGYSGSMTGTSIVQIFETLDTYAWPVMTSSTTGSAFTITGLRDGNFYLKAFKDVNANGVRDSFEPYGVYGGTTAVQFAVSGGVTSASLAITLAEPAVGSVSGNLSYYGLRAGTVRLEAARPRGGDSYDMEVIKFSTVPHVTGTVDQAYTLTLLAPATDYTIRAYVDENGNNWKDVMEPSVSSQAVTITANAEKTGVNLVIIDPGSGAAGNSTLSGSVSYTPTPGQGYVSTGTLWVGWGGDRNFDTIFYSQTVSAYTQYASSTVWTYSKGAVLGGATYYMAAFLDLNLNGQPDEGEGEPVAMYSIAGEEAPIYVPTSSTVVRNLAIVSPSTGSISGVVHYYGTMTGPAKVQAWNNSCEDTGGVKDCSSTRAFVVVSSVTDYPFTLSFLRPTTSYQLSAWIDLNGNSRTDPGEPNAYDPGFTVSGSTNAVLTLMDPGQGQLYGGNIGEIRGTVVYDGPNTGAKIVRLFRGGFNGAPVQTLTINTANCAGNSCSFTISGLLCPDVYYLDAFVDANVGGVSNGIYEPAFEPYGSQSVPVGLTQMVPYSPTNSITMYDPGGGINISTGSSGISGVVSLQGGGVTPSGTLRVQLFKFDTTASVMQVPVRVVTYAYTTQTSVNYSFNDLPVDAGARYLAQAFVDTGAQNSFLDRNEPRGQTRALNQGISTSDPAEQKNFSVCASTSIEPGQNLSGSLAVSDCLSPDRGQTSAYMDYYSFIGSAGDIVTVEMTGTGFSDTYLYLYGPAMSSTNTYNSYNLLAYDDDSAGNYNAKINGYALPANGVYTIGAASYGSSITGAYTVSLRVSGGTNGSIAGTVRYNGTQGGSINVGLFNSDPRTDPNANPLTGTSMSVPGAFTFSNLPSGTSYYIGGFVDVNANNSPDQGEDFGMYPNVIALRAGQTVTGALLEINPSTETIFVGGAGQGTISGAINYTGVSNATTLVIEMWNTATFMGTPIGIRTIQVAPGGLSGQGYDLQVPGDQTYYLKAFLDGNNNRMPDMDEAKGAYEPNNEGPEPIYVGSAAYVSDRNFTLYDAGQFFGGLGASGEGWASVYPSTVAAGTGFDAIVTVRVNGLGAGGVVMAGLPGNIYSSLNTTTPGPGYVRVSLDGTTYNTTNLTIPPPAPGSYMASNNARYTVPAGGLAAGTSVYFYIQQLYAPCQGGMAGMQTDNSLRFHAGTSSSSIIAQPLASGEPVVTLGAGEARNMSFRLRDFMNGYNMSVPNGEPTAMLAESRDNCWNLAPISPSVVIATVGAYSYNQATYGYDLPDTFVGFSTAAEAAATAVINLPFAVNSSSAVFYVTPSQPGYRNIGLTYDLGYSNTFYMGVQVMSGGGITGVNVSTGSYNNLSASSRTITITPNGDGVSDRSYINFTLGDANMSWHVIVSSIPLRDGEPAIPLWEAWGWGQPNPGQIVWEGRYNPWVNYGGVVPTGAYFVRIEAGSRRNDSLRINVVVPQVSGQVTDAGTSPQRPLSGVMVNTYGAFGWGQATTDAGGNFVIPGLGAGQYNFQFSKEEYGMVSSQVVVGVNGATVNASMRRAPALILIPSLGGSTTQQYDQWGWINVHTADWSRAYNGSLRVAAGTTTIDDGGRWDSSTNQFRTRTRIRFDVEASTYTVDAELFGYGRVSSTVYVGSAGLELTLDPFTRKANLSGLVRLPAAASNVNGTWISVNALPVVMSSTNAGGWGGIWLNQGLTSGTYNIFGVDPGSYTIRAQVPGYSGVSVSTYVAGADITGLDMPEFGSGSVIQGTVTVAGNTSSFPMPSWAQGPNAWPHPIKVNVNVWSPQTYSNGWTEIYVATSATLATSTFAITGLDAGTTYQLFAHLDYSRDGGNREFTVPGGFPKQVYVSATSSGTSDFSFAMASGTVFGTILLPTTPAVDFSSVSMYGRITQSENPYAVGETFFTPDISLSCAEDPQGCLPNLSSDTATGVATFSVPGLETQTIELTFTYGLTGMSRTTLINVISGSTVAAVVDLRRSTYSIAGSITNQVSNPLFNTMAAAIANSSYTLPSGYPVIPAGTMPIEAVRRDLNEFGAAMTSTAFDPTKTRLGFIAASGTYTIRGLQEGVYVIRTRSLKLCTTCEMSVAPQEKIVTIRGADYTSNNRVIADGLSVLASSVNFTLIDGWNVSGTIAIENSVSDARTLILTLRNRRNEVVRSTVAALGNAGTNSLANSVGYSFARLPGGEVYTLEVRDTKDSTGTIKYAAAPIRFPASSPNGLQSDLTNQDVTLKQGAMFTLKLRDVNSASLLTQTNYTLLATNFSCFAVANPWVQGGYYVAASSVSGRPIEADGTVRIGPVLPGVYYDVKCEQSNWDVGYMRQGAQNYSPAVVSGIRPSAGETRDLGVLDLRQGQALRGIVSGRDGSPLTNIKVTAKPSYIENPLTVQAMTNRDGLYTLWVSTYVSRFFDITAAPREQNQTVDVSTIAYRESVYTAIDISVSTVTVNFTLDAMLGGVSGSVSTIDGGALSYPFGEMQGYPAAALFLQPYGTVPKNNPIGDIEAITAADGTFSVPLATGAYTMRVVSLGYSVPAVTFTVTGSGMVSFGNIILVKGGTVSGQIRKPDSTAVGGYTEPNSDEINLVAAANDGFTEFVMGTVVSDPVSRTITRYAISGFKPDIDYSMALMSANGDMTFPSDGSVRFSADESTGTKSVNLTFRPSHGDCLAVAKWAAGGLRLKFVCSKAMRNRTAEDNNLTLILATSAVDASGAALASPNGTGALSDVVLSADRKQFTAFYSTAASEGMFSIRMAAYTSEIDQATGDNFRMDKVYDFYTGVRGVAVSKVTNMRGGRVELEGGDDGEERGSVEFPPGAFAMEGDAYALVTTTAAVGMLKADDLDGTTGGSTSAAGRSRAPLSAIRGTVPPALYEAMQALREQRVGSYRTKAAGGAGSTVNPFSSFYDISLPAGISHVLQQPARITLSYDTVLSSSVARDDLNVYYYNPSSQRYVLEASGRTLDPDNGTISVNVDHLSAFVVLAQAPVVSDAYPYTGMELKAHNFPNPFNNKRTKSVAINSAIATGGYAEAAAACVTEGTCIRVFVPRGTTGEMKLKVFNIAGELVRQIELTGYTPGATSVWPWDGKNDSGREVASGVYIGEVKVGGDKAFFKMAVVKDSRYQ